MNYFLATFALMLIVIALMAVGVMFGRRCNQRILRRLKYGQLRLCGKVSKTQKNGSGRSSLSCNAQIVAETSLYWHDYETFGIDPQRDRPSQFAGVRTDVDLNIIDDPLVVYCKPPADYLPHPEACLLTGISPQLAEAKGVTEVEFCRLVHEQFAQPNTCGLGYNSIRFDDEIYS